MKSINIVLIFFGSITVISCALYRGSMITWRVINSSSNPLAIEVLQRHTWNYAWYPCKNAEITAGNYMIGSGTLVCASPCPPNMSTLSSAAVPCTGFNQIEQYVNGEKRSNIQVPPNYIFRAVFTSAAWFTVVAGEEHGV
jgi:hypothetical protein